MKRYVVWASLRYLFFALAVIVKINILGNGRGSSEFLACVALEIHKLRYLRLKVVGKPQVERRKWMKKKKKKKRQGQSLETTLRAL